MKTIEEKAKAYDEALERAKKYWNSPRTCVDINVIPEFFPELRESEDERIRKELIRAFKSLNTIKVWNGIERTDILAWLEKQGEQKPYGQREECVDCQFNYAGECKGSCQMKRSERKSAWSEEDEVRIEQICEDLKCGLENFRSGKNVKGLHFEEIIKSNIDWLKLLKGRVQPQQEWSEEDERIFKEVIDKIEEIKCQAPGYDLVTYDRFLSWLKSLKNRYTWKPSDVQMNAFEQAYNWYNTHSAQSLGLNSLYYDLKKLKGE